MPGVIPGRGAACVDLCPHHITRESSWRSGGAHGRGMDEEHTPMAGATLARMARACRTVLCVACVVWWPVASASPTAGRVLAGRGVAPPASVSIPPCPLSL